jgi:hypothetical protein
VVVVVVAPAVDDTAHVAQAGEPVLRESLVSKAAVEAFDVIPPKPDTRATLGDSTGMHLAGRRLTEPSDIYVAIYPDRIDLIHPDLRNARP